MSSDVQETTPRPAPAARKLRLKTGILVLFLLLTVPVVFTIVFVTYRSNDSMARAHASELVERFRNDAIRNILGELEPIQSLVSATAELANAQPDFFSDGRGLKYLRSLLTHSETLTSVYVGLETGAFRQARRMDPALPVGGQPPPPQTRFAERRIEAGGKGGRQDQYVLLDAAQAEISRTAFPTQYDPRVRPWYKAGVEARATVITEPEVFAALGLIGFSVASPFYRDGRIAGVAAADITLDGLSRYLAKHGISPGTVSFILDARGRVIANSSLARTFSNDRGRVDLQHVAVAGGPVAAAAWAARPGKAEDGVYLLTVGDKDYIAAVSVISDTANNGWQLFVITPVDDFAAELERNNMRLLVFGLIASLLQILVIYALTGILAAPLETLAQRVDEIRSLNSPGEPGPPSVVYEVHKLSEAVTTLGATIRSFSAFVPVGLVSQLIDARHTLQPGGSNRFLTIFFSDLEGFSTLSEELPTHELMRRVSAYIEVVNRAVNREAGTIDKFIGDGVMAFWGAPALLEDHAWHACVAALRVQHDMEKLNAQWQAPGERPLNVRIGIHSDAVVVGNIGSVERLSYTVMGDGVNIASRLEGVNKDYRTRICVSHTVFKEAGERLCVRPIDEVTVKGRRAPVPIYELLGAYGAGPELEPDAATLHRCELTRAAYAAWIHGDRALARTRYEALLAAFPDDTVAPVLLARLADA